MRLALVVPFLWSLLPAQRALLDELPADADAWELRGSGLGAEFTPVTLPGTGTPRGLARIGAVLWFARGDRLLRLSWPEPAVELDVEAPPGLVSLVADARFAYGLVGRSIVVIDPAAGRVARTIDPGAGEEPNALGRLGEQFVLASPSGVFLRDARFEAPAERLAGAEGKASWLVSDGVRLWAGGAAGARAVPVRDPDAKDGRLSWRWPWRLTACAATWTDDRLLIVGERGDRGLVGECVSGLLDLRRADWFGEQLSIACHAATADTPRFLVGPKTVASIEALTGELKRFASVRVRRADGSEGPMPVVLEARPGARVAWLKQAWDAAVAAGFDRVHAPAQEGHALDLRKKAAAKQPK